VEQLPGQVLDTRLDFEEIRGFEGLKEATLDAGGTQVRVAVVSGLHNAEPLVEKILQGVDVGYDLIEVMACPGGCICGAGHPVPEKVDTLDRRQQVLVDIDKTSKYRKSQENPDVLRLYEAFYQAPNSPLAHALLHTHYAPVQGDHRAGSVRRKADSAFRTQEYSVCICDKCTALGSKGLFQEASGRILQQKMDSFINLRTIRLKDTHPGSGVYVTRNGQQVDASVLDDLLAPVPE
jgi:hypothetical protein